MRKLFYTTFLALLQLCWGIKEAFLNDPMCLHVSVGITVCDSQQTLKYQTYKGNISNCSYTLWDIYDIPGSVVSILHPFSHLFHKMILQDGYD